MYFILLLISNCHAKLLLLIQSWCIPFDFIYKKCCVTFWHAWNSNGIINILNESEEKHIFSNRIKYLFIESLHLIWHNFWKIFLWLNYKISRCNNFAFSFLSSIQLVLTLIIFLHDQVNQQKIITYRVNFLLTNLVV